MTARMLFVLILATLLPAAAAAQAAHPSTQYSVTALTLSRAVFGGIRAGLEASFREGKVTADTLACVASLDESGLAPVYQSLMREVLSEEVIRKLDAFYGSEAGRRPEPTRACAGDERSCKSPAARGRGSPPSSRGLGATRRRPPRPARAWPSR